jgi:hypothetical protein
MLGAVTEPAQARAILERLELEVEASLAATRTRPA